uniref:Uncharacterized protein n=1 Tax=Knipowitschia caucasica TaxID=637954 RepID=A0AAV2LEM9_KNICA
MVKCDMGRRGWKGPNCIGCRQKWQLGMASAVTEHRREEAQQTEVSDALVHSTPGSGISVCGVPVSGAPVSGVLIHGWRLDLGSSSRSRICYTYSGVESARSESGGKPAKRSTGSLISHPNIIKFGVNPVELCLVDL